LLRRTLNLGILAHVDAGKTTLTERLLYAAGIIDEIGSVDKGTTQTDSLALEQQRGITIKSAVATFAIDDLTVNLIDTPGHPDFVAEVERVLSVLDGAVLVVSAVEGVQSQSRILMRALERLRIPTLMFVNKVDRVGADCDRVLKDISERLTPATVPMVSVSGEGTRGAIATPHADADPASRSRLVDVLAERDDALVAAYIDDETSVSSRRLRDALAAQTKRALVHPVFFGSAITGAGVDSLIAALVELLPAPAGDADGPVSGTVFKIERGPAGERIAYVRMFSGAVHTRDRVHFGRDHEERVTAISVFDHGSAVQRPAVSAGEIAKLWGLGKIQIGDSIGDARGQARPREFPPPTLESVVVPRSRDERQRLRVALAQLAEQDPLINLRQDDRRQEISVWLYGEVQKEVIQATLADDYGIDVTFRETTTICVERLVGTGSAVEVLFTATNPFLATVGLRVDPAPIGSGVEFRLDVDPRLVPSYIYKTADRFSEFMTQCICRTLEEGLFGWRVIDCVVTMDECGYFVGDGSKRPSRSTGRLYVHTGRTTAADFRKLTPIVLMRALAQAGTLVCEPIARVTLEIPTETMGAVLPLLAQLGAAVETPSLNGELAFIETVLPAARLHGLQRQLPRLTGGEGVLESSFRGYQPVNGEQPARRRTTANPLNLDEYMRHVAGRDGHRGGASDE
jgi:ribosomal protection tetracycline resistance protein